MKWVDQYAKAIHNSHINMTPVSWGPLNAIFLFQLLQGSFLSKVHQAVTNIQARQYSPDKIARSFPSPSTLRVVIFYLTFEYQAIKNKDKKQFKETVEFLVKILQEMVPADSFAYQSNPAHSLEEIKNILNTTKWVQSQNQTARETGKLYNSLSALIFSLYTDFFPQYSHEIYGPYDASQKFGEGSILLIKHFPKLKPVKLWPQAKKIKYSDIKIFQVYKNIKFKCELVGMHSIYQGDLINNLVSYAIKVDNQYQNDLSQIKKLSDYFAQIATELSSLYEDLPSQKLKEKMLEGLCYQLFDFFELAQMDWRPTKQMLEIVRDKKVPHRLELNKYPPFEEFINSPDYEVYWLKDLYK